jgi:aspartyl aminopeptidase
MTKLNHGRADKLLAFIDESPTPWHAVKAMARELSAAGFRELQEGDEWKLAAGDACYVIRGGSALAAFIVGTASPASAGYRIVGAHTDSPGLRLKPGGLHEKHGQVRLGVEVYGGPILASWTDRELGLAGRLVFKGENGGIRHELCHLNDNLLRLPNLAIHLNRDVNNKGLVLDKQDGLPLLLGEGGQGLEDRLLELCCEGRGERAELLDFELCACDTQPAAFYGLDEEFYATGRIDNLAMCHAGLLALLDLKASGHNAASTAVGVFYDNEEVGSQSAQGADGSFLPDLLERVQLALEAGREAFLRACSHSYLVSADMAHAIHPNGANLYEPQHHVLMNHGPVIKQNANLRYTSNSTSAARFRRACEAAGVPVQTYVHRTDLPCGSTIGPMASASLGIEAVDVGNPMLSMHSIRECAGTLDHEMMISAMVKVFEGGA